MALSQEHISADTPLGGHLLPGGGATFRAWAPAARAVHLIGSFNDWQRDEASLLARDQDGRWSGFEPRAREGDEYLFYVVGEGSEGEKRDPYARELTLAPAWPESHCILVDPARYPWHDQGFRPPDFSDLAIYQLHVGCWWGPDRSHRVAKLLDAALRVPYLAELGVNAVQLLPVVEFQSMFSMGYNGTDYFSPEMDYEVSDAAELERYAAAVNGLLAAKGQPPLAAGDLRGGSSQLKALVDLCHLHGLAVVLDVVYNHAGGDFGDESLFFFDRQPPGDNRRSLYFTGRGWAGGLVFDFARQEVRRFLVDNALYWLGEMHMDGLRYDEVSVIDRESEPAGAGWLFCQELTDAVRAAKLEAVQNAEYWPVNPWAVRPRGDGGAGFDIVQHDALRLAVRAALAQASWGMAAPVDMGAVAAALVTPGFAPRWRAIQCVENHDRVYRDREPRVPALADRGDPRSWYARSRARVAAGLVLTAPGIPMLFMGQELLEHRQWHDSRSPEHLIRWDGLDGGEREVTDFLRFVQELLALRRRQPALRRGELNAFHWHDGNRVLAFHRWLEAEGRDAVVVASLNDETFWRYDLGFPRPGEWSEAFNSDIYEGYVNPRVAGNGGRVTAGGGPLHGLPASAAIVIPANSVLVFTRDPGA